MLLRPADRMLAYAIIAPAPKLEHGRVTKSAEGGNRTHTPEGTRF